MSRRTLYLLGCGFVGACFIALCCVIGIFIYTNANDVFTAFITRIAETPQPIPTFETIPEFVTPAAPDETPAPRATISPRIPFPTPYTIPTRYPVTLDENYSVEPYQVSGDTPNQIRTALNQQGVLDKSGKRFDAETRWHLNGKWDWRETGSGCEVDYANYNIEITLVIPTLAISSSTSDSLLNGWNKYTTNLKIHESGHIVLDMQEARKLRDEVANFPPASDCATLRLKLQARFDQTLSNLNKFNVDYDAKTNHGATQGATYP